MSSGYVEPDIYTGSATLNKLYSSVNSTHYTLVYRCRGCFEWNQAGSTGGQPSTQGYFLLGWANAYSGLDDPSSVNASMTIQHDSQGLVPFGTPSLAVQASYSTWATKTFGGSDPTGGPTTTKPPTTTTKPTTTTIPGNPAPTDTYDYIIVGAGAAGLVVADKLSEAGKKVVLIERGPPSSYRWGGRIQPDWLKSSNVTRFDVPGLDNEIWHNSAGIACSDIDQMAGCVLGGGVAVNAGLWFRVPDADWDYNFPSGWKSGDIGAAASRVFNRIPGTEVPSVNGQLYGNWGYDLLSKALQTAGWTSVKANSAPNSKNKAFSHPPFMYINGERGGPMATYLVSANARKNFKLLMNTDIKRVVRTGGKITGVEAVAYGSGGYTGTFKVTPNTGRVILSAGTFGSARILMRSGIGPADMLSVVQKSADGPTMIPSTSFINLPVGSNLNDHVNTDTVISHPSINFYDYYEAYNSPIPADANLYLKSRSGMLAQSAPNIAPVFWETITPSDGIQRQLQWTARCEGSLGAPNEFSMTISQYLGRGSTSRGRMTIDTNLNTIVSTVPYLRTAGDVEAVTKGIANLQAALGKVANLKFLSPAPGQSASDFVSSVSPSSCYPFSTTNRANSNTVPHLHLGTSRQPLDRHRKDGHGRRPQRRDRSRRHEHQVSLAHLHPHALSIENITDHHVYRVYGTDNLFVVDASIIPGMMTTNPSAMIATLAEHAVSKILALK